MRAAFLFMGLMLTGAAMADTPPRQIAILNDSDAAMVRLQARVPKTLPWPHDLLGPYAVGVGLTAKAAMPPGEQCLYDLLASFDDGSKQEMGGVDTCKPGEIIFKGK